MLHEEGEGSRRDGRWQGLLASSSRRGECVKELNDDDGVCYATSPCSLIASMGAGDDALVGVKSMNE
jgi:hypothetical protein